MEVIPELITSYIKSYPNKVKIIKYKTPYLGIIRPEDLNADKPITTAAKYRSSRVKEEELEKKLQRAKTKISDIVDCNDFDMFVTFTANCRQCGQGCKNNPSQTGKKSGCICDRKTCKRYDVDYQRRNNFNWLNRQKKIHGTFSHLMVMELHGDGAPHFHALLNGYKGKLTEHKLDRKDDSMIYNLAENKRGHTTCKLIPANEKPKVASYIKKYITKDMPLFPGRKRYVCSKGLNRPIINQNPENIDQYLSHPTAEVWEPKTEPYKDKRSRKIIYPKPSNVQSVTTLELDNRDAYFKELALLRRIVSLLPRHTAPTREMARPPLTDLPQATPLHSLTEDSTAPIATGQGA